MLSSLRVFLWIHNHHIVFRSMPTAWIACCSAEIVYPVELSYVIRHQSFTVLGKIKSLSAETSPLWFQFFSPGACLIKQAIIHFPLSAQHISLIPGIVLYIFIRWITQIIHFLFNKGFFTFYSCNHRMNIKDDMSAEILDFSFIAVYNIHPLVNGCNNDIDITHADTSSTDP